MVSRTRELEFAMGSDLKKVEKNEKQTLIVQRRSIRAKTKIFKNELIKKDDLIFLRPCPKKALEPFKFKSLVGKRAKKNIKKEECVYITDVE